MYVAKIRSVSMYYYFFSGTESELVPVSEIATSKNPEEADPVVTPTGASEPLKKSMDFEHNNQNEKSNEEKKNEWEFFFHKSVTSM